MSPGPDHLVLGIETSCDDTSVAVLEEGRRLRAHLIAAQDIHQIYGGVVPELASRAHQVGAQADRKSTRLNSSH